MGLFVIEFGAGQGAGVMPHGEGLWLSGVGIGSKPLQIDPVPVTHGDQTRTQIVRALHDGIDGGSP